MTHTATFFFGALTGAAAMLVVFQLVLSSIKREIRAIRGQLEIDRGFDKRMTAIDAQLRELEREIERNYEH